MILIRSARLDDLGFLVRIARHLNSYNLPYDRDVLKGMLRDSQAAFAGQAVPDDRRRFIFLAEDTETGKAVGSSLIIARHGTPILPHLSFRLTEERKTSRTLGKTVRHKTLQLQSDRTGVTEIGGLALLPAWRGHADKAGKQLSYARFAYMALHPGRFRRKVLVEYLPPLGKEGNALWRALGEKFTGLGYRKADSLSARNKEFILGLFPKEKIYCSLLPEAAVSNIGVPGEGARSSLAILERIGFRFLGQVDPFDGGPHYGAPMGRITLVRRTRIFKFGGNAILENGAGARALVMHDDGRGARAVLTAFALKKGKLYLPPEATRLIGLKPGCAAAVTPFA